ncbi:hypothetical protein IWX50DRAFT_375580 [Phyllosticta citricarpa]
MAVHEFYDQIGPFTARWTTRCKRCIGAGNRPASRCRECLDWLAGRTLARCRGSTMFTKWPVHPRIPATGRLVPVLGEVAGDPPPPHFQRTTALAAPPPPGPSSLASSSTLKRSTTPHQKKKAGNESVISTTHIHIFSSPPQAPFQLSNLRHWTLRSHRLGAAKGSRPFSIPRYNHHKPLSPRNSTVLPRGRSRDPWNTHTQLPGALPQHFKLSRPFGSRWKPVAAAEVSRACVAGQCVCRRCCCLAPR